MRRPNGSSPAKCARAAASLMIATGGAAPSSAREKARPRTSAIPSVWKYSGLTLRL